MKKKTGRPEKSLLHSIVSKEDEATLVLDLLSLGIKIETVAKIFKLAKNTIKKIAGSENIAISKAIKVRELMNAAWAMSQYDPGMNKFMQTHHAGVTPPTPAIDVNLTKLPPIQLVSASEITELPDVIEDILNATRKT